MSSSMNGDPENGLQQSELSEVDSKEQQMPGSFEGANGSAEHTNGDSSPVPPPHKTPSSPPKPAHDPEECKALGNKYFKAKDYTKAIAEYTKGTLQQQMLYERSFQDDIR